MKTKLNVLLKVFTVGIFLIALAININFSANKPSTVLSDLALKANAETEDTPVDAQCQLGGCGTQNLSYSYSEELGLNIGGTGASGSSSETFIISCMADHYACVYVVHYLFGNSHVEAHCYLQRYCPS